MSRGSTAVLVGALIAGLAYGAAAQTTVTVLSANAASPTPLEILDADYPFQSLLANEEGQTGLNLILDATGRVRTPQIISSSGYPLLDGKAAQVARGWRFQPVAQNTLTEVKVEVGWRFPLSSADEYALPLPGSPEGSVVVSPEPSNSHAVQRIDYPTVSIQSNEQGEIWLTFRIRTDGSTSDVQVVDSSGYGRLDASAMRMVERWKYSPGTVDGKVSEFWTRSRITFFLSNSRPPPNYVPPLRCHARPVFGIHERNLRTKDGKLPSGQWWVSLNDSAIITDALLFTSKGWKRVNNSIIHPTSGMPEARALLPSNAYVLGKKPSVPCWISIPS